MLKNKFRQLKRGAKVLCTGLLVTSLACTTTGIGSLLVTATEPDAPARRIIAFDALTADVAEQVLPVGATESSIRFPDSLTVTVGTTVQTLVGGENSESGMGASSVTGISAPATDTSMNPEGTNAAGTGMSGAATDNGATGASAETTDPAAGETPGTGNGEGSADSTGEETDPAVTEPEAGSGETPAPESGTESSGTEETAPASDAPAGDENGSSDGAPTAWFNGLLIPGHVYAAEADPAADPENTEPASEPTDPENTEPAANTNAAEAASSTAGEIVVTSDETYKATLSGLRWVLAPMLSSGSYFSSTANDIGKSYVYVPDVSLYAIAEGVTPPMIRVTIAEGNLVPAAPAAFAQTVLSGGMEIRVTAPEGVFPAGSRLVVTPLYDYYEKQNIEAAIENKLADGSEESRVEESISFDISIVDANGIEIEPNTAYGYVTVAFTDLSALGEISESHDLKVFHFDETTGIEEMPAVIDGSSASVLADSFSVYTVAKVYTSTGVDDTLAPVIQYNGGAKLAAYAYSDKIRITAADYVISPYSNGPYSASYLMTSNSREAHTQTETLWFLYIGNTAAQKNKQKSQQVSVSFNAAGATYQEIPGGAYTVDWGKQTGLIYNGEEQALTTDGPLTVTLPAGITYTYHRFTDSDATQSWLYTVATPPGTGTLPKGKDAGTYNFLGEVSCNAGDTYMIRQEVSVSIAPLPITDASVSVTPASISAVYNEETLPGVFTLKLTKPGGGTVNLVKDEDYTVDLSGCAPPAAGTTAAGTIKVTGKGNFTGTRSIPVTLTANTAETPDPIVAYDGSTTLASQYKNKVTLTTTNNYNISNSATGPFAASYEHTTVGSNQSLTLYFKNPAGTVIKKTLTGITVVNAAVKPTNLNYRYNGAAWKEWFNTDVKLTVDDYVMSTVNTMPSPASYYMFTDEGYNMKHLYFKLANTAGNATSEEDIWVCIDRTAPTGYIEIKDKKYETFVTGDDPSMITKELQEIGITGSDALSGVASISYHIASKQYNNSTDLEKAMESVGWREYSASSKPKINENAVSFVYAKITDKAGNSVYRATGGILHDSKRPEITKLDATLNDKTATVTVTAKDDLSGVDYYYLLVKEKGDSEPDRDAVEASNLKNQTGIFKVDNLDPSKKYVFYAMVDDRASNRSNIEKKDMSESASGLTPAANGIAGSGSGAAGAGGLTPAANGIAGSGAGAAGAAGSAAGAGKSGTGSAAAGSSGKDKEREISRVPYIAEATGNIPVGEAATGGWDKIEAQMKAAPDDNSLSVEMSGTRVIPGTALNTMTGRGLEVTFLMPQDVRWTIQGKDMEEATYNDMELALTMNSKGIPTELINSAADTWPHTDFSIGYSGDFGFPATLSVPIESGTDMYANLFFYDKNAQELKLLQTVQVGADGRAVFQMTHASDYTIVVRDRPMIDGGAAAVVGSTDTTVADAAEQSLYFNPDESTQSVSAPLLKSVTGGRTGMHLWLFLIALISAVMCVLILYLPSAQTEKEKVRVKPALPKLDALKDKVDDEFGEW